MKPLKKSQRLMVIVGGISFYTTVKAARDGVGMFGSVNQSVWQALGALENMRQTESIPPIGIGGHWGQYDVQLDMIL